ncbi:uncharacterized protein LOC127983718 [Carassius gibelio]|uniref:uncharacterized protein LOC127983718 n=1 Tax=Carassius gibelio TaxID=101364 RepID=UPI002277DE7D|nr:uncharacterized protein LOC127983718 [Carassius gibelio]
MNRPKRNSAGRRSPELQHLLEFRRQCWMSSPTDRKGVTLPYSPEGEWVLRNYARLWESISQEEPQRSPPPTQLPTIPEGRVLAVATLGDQASPSQSPEVPSTASSLPMKRGRLFSWESTSESSVSETALPETKLPQPASDPAVASAPRPRRKRRKRGPAGPVTLSPPVPAAESAGVPVPAAESAGVPVPAAVGVPVPAAESAGVPDPAAVSVPVPAAESAGVPVPAAVSAGVPEPAAKRAVCKSAVVRAQESAAADSAAKTLVQCVSSRKEMPIVLAAKAFSDYLSSLVRILEVPVSPVLSSDPVPRNPECPDVVSPCPVDVVSPCPVSVAPCPADAVMCPVDVAPCPVDVPCPVVPLCPVDVSPCPVDVAPCPVDVPCPAVVPPCPAVVSPRPVSLAPRPLSAPIMSPVSCPETPPRPSPPRPARTPRRQPSSCPPKTPAPPTHPSLSPMNFVVPPPPLPCLFFLICHPNPAVVYSCLPLLLFVMSCWFVSVSQSVMSVISRV